MLHVCVHGARWAPESGIRWVADAMLVVEAGGIDWRRLVDQAVTHRFVVRMRDTLGFLQTAMAAPIPVAVMADLGGRPQVKFERVERWILSREHPLLGELPRDWCHHLRSLDGSLLPAVLTFPKYLQHAWGLRALRDVPRGALSRIVRRLRDGDVHTPFAPPGGEDRSRPVTRGQ